MPTDPFVPSELDDQPRHKQNLPPGLGPPPARDWRANRPGDSATVLQPEGPLLGRPGPNVGYAYTLAERAKPRLRLSPFEDADDVVAVVAEIAGKRAAILGRAPVMQDVDRAIALLGYDGSADEHFAELRARLVQHAAHDYYRRRELVDAVPDALLTMASDLLPAFTADWRSELGPA